jgi:hypothetical protein
MTIFNWQITSMPAYPQAEGQTDVVFQVNWACGAYEDRFSAATLGTVPVTYVAGTPYTPYADLTEEQVWGWVNPSIDRAAVEANLQATIDKQKTPPVVTLPLPWQGAQA